MKKPLLLGALVLASCACARDDSEAWQAKLAADPLYHAAAQVVLHGDCAALVPTESHRSFPVPQRGGNGPGYKLLFCLNTARTYTQPNTLLSPVFTGEFRIGQPQRDHCVRAEGPEGPVGPPLSGAARGLSWGEMAQKRAALYDLTARAATLYFTGGEPAPSEKAALASYAGLFQQLAEPGLLPYYYRLNPDFWEWLRREAGASIPKA